MSELERLSKIMASRGMCSRREADSFIEKGYVSVDGNIVTKLGTKVSINSNIKLNSKGVSIQKNLMTVLLNKLIGYVSSQPEKNYKAAITLINNKNKWSKCLIKNQIESVDLHKFAPAGRLDIDSTGLLVLTEDGRIARNLIGSESSIEKEYLVRVKGKLIDNGLQKLNYGLSIEGKKLKRASVKWINDYQLKFILREGKKRQIRKMCEMVGLKVIGLKRVRIGKIKLGTLPLGKWRYLMNSEIF